MPFTPFTKSSKTPSQGEPPSAPPVFSKKPSKRRRKTGKVGPAQKQLMSSGRSLSGGGR